MICRLMAWYRRRQEALVQEKAREKVRCKRCWAVDPNGVVHGGCGPHYVWICRPCADTIRRASLNRFTEEVATDD